MKSGDDVADSPQGPPRARAEEGAWALIAVLRRCGMTFVDEEGSAPDAA
jgi:hypothetical protein